MDVRERRKQLFFNNLIVLGWDSALIKKKYRLESHKNMFDVPNQAMFEVVSFFLLNKLNKVIKGKKYRTMEPPLAKEARRMFQKSLFVDVSNMKSENTVRFPLFTESVLSSCRGDNFYDLFLAFSSHVIYKTIQKNNNVDLLYRPILSADNYNDIKKVLKMAIISSANNLQSLIRISHKHMEVSLAVAKDLTILFQKLKVILADKNACLLKASNSSSLSDENQPNVDVYDLIKKCTNYLKKIQMYWEKLETFLNSENEMWDIVCPVTEENKEKCVLDGSIINIGTPLSKDKNLNNGNEEKSLIQCLTCINAFLERYYEIYKMSNLSNIHKIGKIQDDETILEVYEKLKLIRERLLSIFIPNAKECIDKLQKNISEELHMNESFEDLPKFLTQKLENSDEDISLLCTSSSNELDVIPEDVPGFQIPSINDLFEVEETIFDPDESILIDFDLNISDL